MTAELTDLTDLADPTGSPAIGTGTWTAVCRVDDLVPERGAAALVDGEQVALFRLVDGRVLAVQQYDPVADAYVVARGIVGSRFVASAEGADGAGGGDVPTVAAPMYKQVYDLRTGRCLDPAGRTAVRDQPIDLRTWPVRVVDGVVELEVGRP